MTRMQPDMDPFEAVHRKAVYLGVLLLPLLNKAFKGEL